MNLKVDQNVFNVIDPRVQALKHGKLTTKAFAYAVTGEDCFLLLGDTIYALSQSQYYSYRIIAGDFTDTLTEEQFQHVISNPPSTLTQEQAKLFQLVKQQMSGCTKCQYKKNKNLVASIIAKYQDYCNSIGFSITAKKDVKPYPSTLRVIPNVVSKKIPKFFEVTKSQRTPCFDCVRKHLGVVQIESDIAKAYIKASQVQYGYTKHFVLGLANLQQAYEQTPSSAQNLRDTLLFCIGKSKFDNKLFVPFQLLLKLVTLEQQAIEETNQANTANVPSQDMQIEITQQMLTKLTQLPATVKVKTMLYLDKASKCVLSKDTQGWQGALSAAADQLVQFIPQLSNVIRNRRLLFKASPELIVGTQFDTVNLLDALKQTVSAK